MELKPETIASRKTRISRAQKKLGEARFFLDRLRECCSTGPEHFHYYLSAFLTAAYSVIEVANREPSFSKFRNEWFRKHPEYNEFNKEMRELRGHEDHGVRGADLQEQELWVPFYDVYEDASGRYEVSAPPGIFMSGPPAAVIKKSYHTVVSGKRDEISSHCIRWVEILARLLEDYR